jgi:hypothetical protein
MFFTDAALKAGAGARLDGRKEFPTACAMADLRSTHFRSPHLRSTHVTAADPLRRQHGSGK